MMQRSALIAMCSKITDWCLRLTVFLVPIFFAWFQENFSVFDLNKTLALRFLLGVALIAWLTRFCLTARTEWSGGRRVALFGFLAGLAFLVSTVFSLHPLISLLGSYERQQGLLNLWHYLALFFLIGATVKDRAGVERLIVSLLCGSAVVSAYGLVQAFGWDFLHWGENSQIRIFSTIGQPNFLGHFLAVMLPLTLYAIVWLSPKFHLRLGFCLLAAAELFCLVLTYSRGAWMATLGCLFIFVVWECWHRRKRAIAAVLVALLAAMLIFAASSHFRESVVQNLVVGKSGVVQRLSSILDPFSGSGKSRLLYWQAAWNIMRTGSIQHQLFGFGPDAQADAYAPEYRPEWAYYEQMNSYPDRAHNFLFDVLLQFGIVGALVLSLFMGAIVWRLARLTRRLSDGPQYWLGVTLLASLLVYGLNNLFSFSLTTMNVVLYALLGLAAVTGNGFASKEKSWHFFQAPSRWLISGSIALLLLVLFFSYAVRPYVADYYYFQVKKAEARSDCRATVDLMEKVMEWYPQSHFYQRNYLHHGTNCFSAVSSDTGRRQLAANLLDEAQAIPPHEIQYQALINLAQMYSIVGYNTDKKYYAEAETAYRQLISISPYVTVNYQDYGRLLLWEGKNEEAAAVFKQGLAIAPRVEDAPNDWHTAPIIRQVAYLYQLLGTAYQEAGKNKDAIAAYKQSISLQPDSEGPYKKLADLYYQEGNLADSIRYNELGFDLQPDSSLWPFGLAALYKEKGDKAKALSYARQALEIDPKNAKIEALIKELGTGK